MTCRLEYDESCIYSVSRGPDGRWEVRQRGVQRPLAKFARMEEAIQYARDFQAEARLCRHLGLSQYVRS